MRLKITSFIPDIKQKLLLSKANIITNIKLRKNTKISTDVVIQCLSFK